MMRPHRPDESCLIKVRAAWPAMTLDVAVPRPLDPRYLFGYVAKVGVRRVAHKIASRLAASPSEELVVLVGVGEVLEAPASLVELTPGMRVLFVAPRAHPSSRCIVTSPHLLRPVEAREALTSAARDGGVLSEALAPLAGWSVHAGEALDARRCEEVMACVASAWRRREEAGGGDAHGLRDPHVRARRLPPPPHGARASLVLFGWGHYARTCLMPALTAHYDVLRVHEIDTQLIGSPPADERARWSTSPLPDEGDEQAALWCVAGYHHHHAGLAIRALEHGVDVLVEKPLVTSAQQLDALLEVWTHSTSRLWQGFHRRTWQVNEWLTRDLEIQRGRSVVHYHCVVHEVNLPAHHWYRWRASGSRLIMNGCHWLDEFMHLNGYRRPVHLSAQSFQDGEVVMVQVQLEHGATCALTLSSVGSDRLGVRESTHVSCGERSARLTDWRYTSEHATGVIRRARCDESTTYARMISAVSAAQKDAARPGECRQDVERFWRMMFELDAML